MALSSRYLMQGAILALEQSGILLHDAVALYHMKSFATAAVLAAYAREEFGRHCILLGLRDRVLNGEPLTIEQIRDACDDHVEKQGQGISSATISADQDTELGKLLRAKMNDPASREYQEADETLAQIDKVMHKRTPSDRDTLSTAALYLEPISETEWRRPAAHVSKGAARSLLVDAINDYSRAYARFGTLAVATLREDNPDLYREIAEWTERPALPYAPPISVL
jgi:AbiV family abortive infection protein